MELPEIDAETRIRVQGVYLGKRTTSREEVFKKRKEGNKG